MDRPEKMKYCVVGNIVKEHTDKDGIVRYGSRAFPGGRKVYITRCLWHGEVEVLGMNRYKTYVYDLVPLELIENIRFKRTMSPIMVERMKNTDEFPDTWWGYKEEDRIGAMEYVELLNRIKAGETKEQTLP
ncbi:MAG: hypothetical protein IJP43_03740 [Oscillospiraceae bacterium]|nr:hypothetical protein [Oscillospiraceae bacterium]